MRQFVRYRIVSFSRPFQNKRRWALNFDGVGVRGQLANRAINVDGDIVIEWYQDITLKVDGSVILSQCGYGSNATQEFRLTFISDKRFEVILGGTQYFINLASFGNSGLVGMYKLEIKGSSITMHRNGELFHSGTITRGAAREPNAVLQIGVRGEGTKVNYFLGKLYNVRVNGVRWPMADRNQAIQLPEPSGLGVELITQSVLENPVTKGGQWTYLGNGRWQYVGDGAFNNLDFIALANQPATGFVQFEVESISGIMRCSPNSFNNPVNSKFSSVGVFRYFFTTKDNPGATNGNCFSLVRESGVASCVIKNISFKPLGTCNPMTISNATSANWMQVVDDYVRKFRKILRFDGVGARGVLANRAIDLDGDIDIEWTTGPNATTNTGTEYCVVSQCVTNNFTAKEFRLYFNSAFNALQAQIGSVYTGSFGVAVLKPNTRYRFTLKGNLIEVFVDGVFVGSSTFTRGSAREPTAVTVVGAETHFNNTIYRAYFRGEIYNLKINGVTWPVGDANQTIQLPEPSGLGAELITQSVLENPFIKGSHWTYLGDGRWQYVGDGSANELRFLTSPQHPEQGYLEFEIESISGMLTCTNAGTARSRFDSTGVKRFFYTDFNEVIPGGAAIIFKRTPSGQVASCIIKNISFKPLGTCNPITLANTTSANWEDLEI